MSVDELHDVLRETLEAKGTMSRLRASIRAEVFGALQDENEQVPKPTKENLLINDLIREYLAFNHYDHTLSVFMPESGQPKSSIDRRYLSELTNLPLQNAVGGPDGRTLVQLPLLYGLLAPPLQSDHATVQAQPRSRSEAPISIAGTGASSGMEDAAVTSRYRAAAPSQSGTADDEPIPGTSKLARPKNEPRSLGGGAPDPLVFRH